MPEEKDFFEGVTFRNGYCVNCDTPIQTGILCVKCTEGEPVSSIIYLPSIAEMQIQSFGFIVPWAVFEAEEQLWAINNYLVTPKPDERNSTKIRRNNDGTYVVDKKTIEISEIAYGWPGFTDPSEFTKVTFE